MGEWLVVLTTPLKGGCGNLLALFALMWWAFFFWRLLQ